MDHIIMIISTGFYSGMLPVATGVYGSTVAVFLWYLCRNLALSIYIGITAGLFFIGWLSAGPAEKIFAAQDAGPIVIDEILGIFVTLTSAPK